MLSDEIKLSVAGLSPYAKIRKFQREHAILKRKITDAPMGDNRLWSEQDMLLVHSEFNNCPNGGQEVLTYLLALQLNRTPAAIRIQRNHLLNKYPSFDNANNYAKDIRELVCC